MNGAEVIIQFLIDQGVDTIFGYPGGASLPIYDVLYKHPQIRHILVRHEQGAVHAAEGYARSTGKLGVILVTSGPGATNTITGLADAMLDSTPLVCITTQVASHLIGTDAFQEADIIGITRSISKYSYLVKDVRKIIPIFQEAFYLATNGRPGPVVIDVPKDIQMSQTTYEINDFKIRKSCSFQTQDFEDKIDQAIEMMAKAEQPVVYGGGGIVISGTKATEELINLVHAINFPITLTLMGLGAYPASDHQYLGMLGMHGTYEANMAMHDCDLMLCVGARFDDRVTAVTDKFAPHSKKIQIDIDPTSINKNVMIDLAIVGDAASILNKMRIAWQKKNIHAKNNLSQWWKQIEIWRDEDCLYYQKNTEVIKPQYAIERLHALTKNQNPFVSTDVGQHQMWTAQYYKFEKPRHLLTSGGLGTMGFGLPAAIGVQIAHPDALVICITSESSFMMNMQEIATAVEYKLPIKIVILNNRFMGMVRQWQELFYQERYSHTYFETQPNFVKLAEAFDAVGLIVDKPADLDAAILKMLDMHKPTILIVMTDPYENVMPMIPVGKAHKEMILPKK